MKQHGPWGDGPVLVTGSNGYLGAHVAKLAQEKGYAVAGAARSGAFACDLSDSGSVGELVARARPGAVIHCAAEVPETPAQYDDSEAAARNLEMCKNLFEACDCPVIFASSMTVYGDRPPCPVKEADTTPGLEYARAKLEAEGLLARRKNSWSAAIRLPGLFGMPRKSGLLYNAARKFLTGSQFSLDGDPPVWAGLDVRDAAEYMLRLLERPLQHGFQAYNAGYPGRFSVGGAVELIAQLCGVTWVAPESPVAFEMDLTRTHTDLGRLQHDFRQRLEEMVGVVSEHLEVA